MSALLEMIFNRDAQERELQLLKDENARLTEDALILKGRMNGILRTILRELLQGEAVLGDFNQDIVDQAQEVVDNPHFGVF